MKDDLTTKQVLALREQEVDQHYVGDHQVRPVTGSAARLTEGRRAVLLLLNDPHRAKAPMVYALSPPDALYLSKELRRAVKDYLRGAPDPETE